MIIVFIGISPSYTLVQRVNQHNDLGEGMRRLLTLFAITLLTFGSFAGVSAHGDDNNDDGANQYDRNGDEGAATANPAVNANSSCFNADQFDRQQLSDANSTNRNVHNDACFLDNRGDKVDGPASFQSFGVGFISACRDPDGAGPKYAALSDTNGDGRADLCFQSGYQEKESLVISNSTLV